MNKKILILRNLTLILALNFITLSHAVLLPSIYSNHMVLQQNQEVKIWGWGKPLENIVVTTSWDTAIKSTIVDNTGNWATTLRTPVSGGPYTITVKGINTIVINDVLIGEVWICSGQSNMEWSASSGITEGKKAIENAKNTQLRFFSVSHRSSVNPQLDVVGEWKVCTPETMTNFSAVGYFFGQSIYENVITPVGLINSSWGGTPAEIWMDAMDVNKDPLLSEGASKLVDVPWGPKDPGVVYNTMIYPLTNYRIAGAIWYQGESNVSLAKYYTHLLEGLIKSWRKAWNYEFPFYFVQIAPYDYGTPNICAELQNAQRLVNIENTGMVVINDIGDTTDIHPKNKAEVGKRLANLALAKHYGKPDIKFSGPLYREMKVEKNTVRVFFDFADDGLKMTGKALKYFELAGKDKKFYIADAKIEGSTVIVTSRKVKEPIYVRFAWSNTAVPNLFNSEGLPTSCFTSENSVQ